MSIVGIPLMIHLASLDCSRSYSIAIPEIARNPERSVSLGCYQISFICCFQPSKLFWGSRRLTLLALATIAGNLAFLSTCGDVVAVVGVEAVAVAGGRVEDEFLVFSFLHTAVLLLIGSI